MAALWFVFAAAILVILSKVPLALAMAKEGKGYNNRHPRLQQERLAGWGKRAHAAHYNTIESFPIFAAGMIIGHFAQGNPDGLLLCGVIFLICRILYIYFYIADIHLMRSMVWGIAYFASLAAYLLALI
ncbi:MAG: MAPEG family protein [Oligoflexus sp.]